MSIEKYDCDKCGYIFGENTYWRILPNYCPKCGSELVMRDFREIKAEIMKIAFGVGLVSCSKEAERISRLLNRLEEMYESSKKDL